MDPLEFEEQVYSIYHDQGWNDLSMHSLAVAFIESLPEETQRAFILYLREVQATENEGSPVLLTHEDLEG